MKDKKLEANLSMVASRVMAGLNMNGLKFLLPLWLGALTNNMSLIHISEPKRRTPISYAELCLKKQKNTKYRTRK